MRVYERDGSFGERAQGYGLTLQQGAKALQGLGFGPAALAAIGVSSHMHHSFLPDQVSAMRLIRARAHRE